MTFKHSKFEDSVTMRSLERVAREKGWVKEETIVKSASQEKDLNPTGILAIDILNLCAGLRQNGFDKQASEIESKFMAYKQAATDLFNVHNETGEDLLEFAHPKGSVTVEENGDGVVEDLIDQHLKMLRVVDKKPTGKLASSKDILSAVKTVLGESSFLEKGKANTTHKIAQIGPDGMLEMPKNLAKGSSSWSRLLGYVSRLGGAEIGGSAGTAGSVAAFAGAVLVGAIGGAIVGNALFDKYLEPNEIQEAGNALVNKASDLAGSLGAGKASVANFRSAFGDVINNYPSLNLIKENKKPENSADLKNLRDSLLNSNKYAMSIRGWASSAIDDKGDLLGNVYRALPAFNPLADLVTLATNYTAVANTLYELLNKFIDDVTRNVEEKTKSNTTSEPSQSGSQGTLLLTKKYQDALQQLSQFKDITSAKQLSADKSSKINSWIESMTNYILGEQKKFNATTPANKELVAPDYQKRLDDSIARISNVRKRVGI